MGNATSNIVDQAPVTHRMEVDDDAFGCVFYFASSDGERFHEVDSPDVSTVPIYGKTGARPILASRSYIVKNAGIYGAWRESKVTG